MTTSNQQNQQIVKAEPPTPNGEAVTLSEVPSFNNVNAGNNQGQTSADQNPALVYLATLRPSGRRGMRHALNVMAEIASNGQHQAETFPWPLLRYQHTAAIATALTQRYRPATVNQALCALRGVLYQAWKLGQISTEDYNRARDVKSVRSETLPRGRALGSGELAALMNACALDQTPAGARDAALIGTLYSAGLRRSEVVKLNLDGYNREDGSLTVRGGKGGKDRLCYLGASAETALADWLHLRGPEPGALFCPINKGGRVIPAGLTAQAVLGILQKRAKEAGVSSFSPHDLRRTFISDLLDAGADISTVQKLAGHANVQTTARYDRRGEVAKRRAAHLLHLPYQPRRSTVK